MAPKKSTQPSLKDASTIQLLSMARLAVASEPGVRVSDIEVQRAGPSFTIDTARAFLEKEQGSTIVFIVGADSVPELKTWKDARELVKLVQFAAVPRPGRDLEADLKQARSDLGAEITRIPMSDAQVSSTEVRTRLRDGQPIDGLVPEAVREYIAARGLYKPTKGPRHE